VPNGRGRDEGSAASHVGGLTHYAARFVELIEQAIDATAT
jgi:hypothetical protein